MPIQVNVEVNGRPVEVLHIGRMRGGTEPDSENLYSAVLKPVTPFMAERAHSVGLRTPVDYPSNKEWDDGAKFVHRYGDGLTVCVAKAFQAITASKD